MKPYAIRRESGWCYSGERAALRKAARHRMRRNAKHEVLGELDELAAERAEADLRQTDRWCWCDDCMWGGPSRVALVDTAVGEVAL